MQNKYPTVLGILISLIISDYCKWHMFETYDVWTLA